MLSLTLNFGRALVLIHLKYQEQSYFLMHSLIFERKTEILQSSPTLTVTFMVDRCHLYCLIFYGFKINIKASNDHYFSHLCTENLLRELTVNLSTKKREKSEL